LIAFHEPLPTLSEANGAPLHTQDAPESSERTEASRPGRGGP
jgi:hypothetical protein